MTEKEGTEADAPGGRVTMEFPPQPVAHDPACPRATGGERVTRRTLNTMWRWAFVDDACIKPLGDVVLMQPTHEDHAYQGSQIWPANASRELCSICRSTHAGELSLNGSHIGKYYGKPEVK